MLAEIDRLERIYSIFDSESELSQWKQGTTERADVSHDLATLLSAGLHWRRVTNGLFNPALAALTQRWRQAEKDDTEPSPAQLAILVDDAANMPYDIDGTSVSRTDSCRNLDFNALAKGLIVDLATDAAWRTHQLDALVVNLGGDLVHRGRGSARVLVEDPGDRAANATPVSSVEVSNAAAATSGSSWRGFSVGGRWLGHVLDPRTGRPSAEVVSATVVATDSTTADAVATALTILGADAGIAFADSLAPAVVSCLIIGANGVLRSSASWAANAAQVRPSPPE